MVSAIQLQRDPFGRRSLMRECVRAPNGATCVWCGNYRRGGHLFRYYWVGDGIMIPPIRGRLYDSVECWRADTGG